MIDIYHFTNPLSENCLATEECLEKLTHTVFQKARLRFIPLINEQVSAKLIQGEQSLPLMDIPYDRESLICRVILDFKAAQIEGNKKARPFLLALQTALINKKQVYSHSLITAIATQIGLNPDDFLKNRMSQEVVHALITDQKLAWRLLKKYQVTIAIDDSNTLETNLLTNFSKESLTTHFTHSRQQFVVNTKDLVSSENTKTFA
ncbi:DsbA family protein [Leuconostoc falkenbergense]|uniref:DsbA family protein n=1 Tax=Leuconostoc falkenbergense TaxID=2766470 RepID=UPI002958CA44|nr:DsbA family protein [Leuconostoc falkenbergense]MDV8950758.1 dithiol-disulfide isomerase [Leuconostoc falkenbergense]